MNIVSEWRNEYIEGLESVLYSAVCDALDAVSSGYTNLGIETELLMDTLHQSGYLGFPFRLTRKTAQIVHAVSSAVAAIEYLTEFRELLPMLNLAYECGDCDDWHTSQPYCLDVTEENRADMEIAVRAALEAIARRHEIDPSLAADELKHAVLRLTTIEARRPLEVTDDVYTLIVWTANNAKGTN